MSGQPAVLPVDAFLQTSPGDRVDFVRDFFLSATAYISGKWNALDIFSVEPDTFRKGVSAALDRDPSNLVANRIAAWLDSRDGRFESAFRRLLQLAPTLSDTADERRELLRLAFLQPNLLSDQLIGISEKALTSDLARASYGYQFARAAKSDDWKLHRDGLERTFERIGLQLRPADQSAIVSSTRSTSSNRDDFFGLLDSARRIAIVGNGPSLRGARRGPEIDKYDLVVRCNFPKIEGHEQDVGTRTDIVFFTEALFRLFPMYLARDPGYANACLVTLRNPAAAANVNPDGVAQAAGTSVTRLPSTTLDAIEAASYRHSTTGAHAYLLFAGILRKQITIFGFDFYSQKELHYFSQGAGLWLAHEVHYEKFLFTEVVRPVLGAFQR